MPGSNSRPNVSEGYEVPLSYRGDRHYVQFNKYTYIHTYIHTSIIDPPLGGSMRVA